VLCSPVGQEYIRAHRAFRQLATQLARSGHHVLRFDYSGQGDSAGTGWDSTIAEWAANVKLAADELRDMGGADETVLIGLRVGATIAARAADAVGAVDLVLWDPVLLGRVYLEELFATYLVTAEEQRASASGGTIGVGSLPLSPALRAAIDGLDLQCSIECSAPRALVISSVPSLEAEQLAEKLRSNGTKAVFQHVPMSGNWIDADAVGAIVLPQQIIRAIVAHVNSGEA
jgi:pimeloyl-ACP methyl ester carboxylesterase